MNPRIRNLYPSVTRDGRFSKECQQLLVLYIIQNEEEISSTTITTKTPQCPSKVPKHERE
ncbi:hypothetical protein OUZ56_001604 [Daphnia magna]|uniref:Uncharacterized protein n=1 Tax=Daphnia magna TaxID=35525 RepID=A0ABR0A3M7_9CRUS|nr:hypothetical protein OUZ56_001604 [Daphnia magna]